MPLEEVKPIVEPNEALIERLRELLGWAEQGIVRSAAIATTDTRREVTIGYILDPIDEDHVRMLGGVRLLEDRVLDALRDR